MITPGLYRHYKGPVYRVLFVAKWNGPEVPLPPDTEIGVYFLGGRAAWANEGTSGSLLTVKWSENGGRALFQDPIVIYVSLSAEGRMSARTMREFEESVDAPCADGGSSHRVPRFERIGE